MQSPQVQTGEGTAAIGLSWMLDKLGDARLVAHGGGTNGQLSTFMFMPDHDYALIILTNADSGAFLNGQLTTWLMSNLFELEMPTPPKPTELPAEALDEYVGTYGREAVNMIVRRTAAGLELESKTNKPPEGWEPNIQLRPSPLGFLSADKAIVTGGLMRGNLITFIRDADGGLQWLRSGGRLHRLQK